MKPFSSFLIRAAGAGMLVFGVFGARAASAQVVDPRWQPWLGCWAANDVLTPGVASSNAATGLVCVSPAAQGAGVEVATIANGVVVHRELLNPTGARTAKTVDNCPGWESATWSADNRRLMLRSEYVCGNNVKVRGSGVFAISRDGEWIQVQGSSVGANASARAVRYRPSGLQLAVAAAGEETDSSRVHLVSALTGFSVLSARSAAGESVLADDVLEVARHVDGPVAEAWLNEVEQRFVVDGRDLTRLADAGMPSSMIDLMVALSYPERFAVRRNAPAGAEQGIRRTGSGVGEGMGRLDGYGTRWNCGLGNEMLSYGYYGNGCYPDYYGYGYSAAYGRYGGYGYGPYGYNGYNYGNYGGYYYGTQPIIIIQQPASPSSRAEGRAVNGSGYTRRTSEPSSSSPTTRSSTSGSSSGASSSGASSGASSSAGSSSSGSSSGGDRTAKPRVPPG